MSSENGDSLRDKILEADDLQTEAVEIPEWDCTVYVRGMSGIKRDELENYLISSRKGSVLDVRGWKARTTIATACNEDGELIFGSTDVEALNLKSSRALNRIFEVAQRLSGVDVDEAKEIAKNLVGVPSDSSGSS